MGFPPRGGFRFLGACSPVRKLVHAPLPVGSRRRFMDPKVGEQHLYSNRTSRPDRPGSEERHPDR